MQNENKLLSTQNLIKIAFLSAIAAILMQWGIKLPAIFPSFLEIDFSEMPALIAILTVHPLAGIVVVILKNVLKAFDTHKNLLTGQDDRSLQKRIALLP